jgi:transposase
MARINRRRLRPELKFQVVLDVLQGKPVAEAARMHRVHPVTIGQWKREFLEKGPTVFGGGEEGKTFRKRIGELERLIGQKELEIALLKNFSGGN